MHNLQRNVIKKSVLNISIQSKVVDKKYCNGIPADIHRRLGRTYCLLTQRIIKNLILIQFFCNLNPAPPPKKKQT